VPDPNYFGGRSNCPPAANWRARRPTEHAYADGNYRIIGVADMAHAIRQPAAPRQRRAGLHVLEVMEAFQTLIRRGPSCHRSKAGRAAGAAARRWRSANSTGRADRAETIS
jgi:hypothetical protein